MRLDDHVFEEIAMALGAVAHDDGELRHRRCARFAVEGEAVIKPYGVAHAVSRSVRFVDISPMGIGFVDQTNVSPGDRFSLNLPRAGGNSLDVLFTVRQCRFSSSGGFRIGAEFTGEMEVDSRLVLGARGLVNAPIAAVGSTGQDLNLPARAFLVSQGPEAKPVDVLVQDISKVAFTLTSDHAFAAGEHILLQFKSNQIQPSMFWCTVMHVRHAAERVYRMHTRNDGPYVPPTPEKRGVSGLLQRLFKSMTGRV